LRRLLDMLRAERTGSQLAPQPGLAELDLLVARTRDVRLPVTMRVEGSVRPLPPGLELTAYRVVQEALTNALKHARPSCVEVLVRYSPSRLDVQVENDGVLEASGDAAGGHGLVGMTERVSLYGGALRTGKRPGGRFRVEAELPLEAAPA
jgi:signal transduction histidine kinase